MNIFLGIYNLSNDFFWEFFNDLKILNVIDKLIVILSYDLNMLL